MSGECSARDPPEVPDLGVGMVCIVSAVATALAGMKDSVAATCISELTAGTLIWLGRQPPGPSGQGQGFGSRVGAWISTTDSRHGIAGLPGEKANEIYRDALSRALDV
jgi:hypothetical protein